MNRAVRRTVCGLAATLFAGSLLAQELMIYPKENQSQEQQEQDKFQCYSWARGETGFDPMAPPTATEPPPRKAAKQGGVARGAAGGAIVGGIFGGSDGAKKGAAAGGVMGGMRRQDQQRRERQARQQWEQDQARQYQEGRNRYNRAYAACLEGREYTVR